MTPRLDRLARFVIRHRRVAVIGWIVTAVAITVLAGAVGKQFADDLSLPGQDSQAATDLVEQHFPGQINGTNPVLFKAEKGAITDQQNQELINRTVKSLEAEEGVSSVVSPFSKQGQAQISKEGKIAYASVTLADGPGELSVAEAENLVDVATAEESDQFQAAVGGYLGQQVSSPSTESSEAIGLTVAAIVLVLTFGSVIAMGMPILTALMGLLTGLGLITLLSNVTTISTTSPTLATMIGLGVGIDYALFIVTRHRSGLAAGLEPDEAAARATATAGGAVLFAGTTVIIALLALGLAGIPLVWTLGYAAAIAVLTAILVSLTFLPALLAWVGHGMERLRVPLPHSTHPDGKAHGWARWANWVADHPWISATVGVVLLLILAWPATNMRLGQEDLGELPEDTQTRQAYDLTSEGFGVGENGPLLIAVKLNGDPQAVPDLIREIGADEGIKAVTPAETSKDGKAAIFTAVPNTSPSSFTTQDTVLRLRDEVIPKAVANGKAEGHVGGSTAGYIDLGDEISQNLPLLIAVVVLLSVVLLLFAFRSIVIPLQAALMNLISVAAAYGIITFVFQEGHGASLIGLDGSVPVVSFLPLVMFAILFGLSMDYQVFLLTQIKEARSKFGKDRHAVIEGLAGSARVITSAAAIMVAVFASFILNGDPVVKQFGVGLAFAVAIDATIVRCLLVPAMLVLTSRWNWWLPGWLDRALPRLDIEGNEYYETRPAN
ncbi:MAG: putative drug exporter of the superfamily [Actinomycetota bacterium]|jgi:RND superfamily putative drug exporter|nr:putative drug exporter of the superfamily [Actinomycetota bacterium]